MTAPTGQSWASSPGVRRSMLANRSRNTRPELAFRHELYRLGFRYRIHYSPLASKRWKVDVAFPGRRLAVFIDGCFWHRCPQHHALPKSNVEFWRLKVLRNVARDRRLDAMLLEQGWMVLRVWEHDDPEAGARLVAATLASSLSDKTGEVKPDFGPHLEAI